MTEQELFVSDIWQDCKWYVNPEPITVDDAAAMFKELDSDGVEYPDMTPEEYATLWNARCSLTDTPSNATISTQSKGETTMKGNEKYRVGSIILTGMSKRDVEKLDRIMNPPTGEPVQTVADYLKAHPETKTETRTSTKGTELIRVLWPDGRTIEYETSRLDSQPCPIDDTKKGVSTMKKQDAYITEDSFGSVLPASWEYAAQYLNLLIDELPEDKDGEIDTDEVRDIWERYSNGDYNDDMAAQADASQLYAMIRDWTEDGQSMTQAMKDRLQELCEELDPLALTIRHWDAIASYMDDDIREKVHSELAPCTEIEFLNRYLELDPDFSDLLDTEFSIRF